MTTKLSLHRLFSVLIVLIIYTYCISPPLQTRADPPASSETPKANYSLHVVTTNTQGESLVIRFKKDSGETWTLDKTSWKQVEEKQPLPAGDYELTLLRVADNNVLVLRIEKATGKSWFVDKSLWIPIEESQEKKK